MFVGLNSPRRLGPFWRAPTVINTLCKCEKIFCQAAAHLSMHQALVLDFFKARNNRLYVQTLVFCLQALFNKSRKLAFFFLQQEVLLSATWHLFPTLLLVTLVERSSCGRRKAELSLPRTSSFPGRINEILQMKMTGMQLHLVWTQNSIFCQFQLFGLLACFCVDISRWAVQWMVVFLLLLLFFFYSFCRQLSRPKSECFFCVFSKPWTATSSFSANFCTFGTADHQMFSNHKIKQHPNLKDQNSDIHKREFHQSHSKCPTTCYKSEEVCMRMNCSGTVSCALRETFQKKKEKKLPILCRIKDVGRVVGAASGKNGFFSGFCRVDIEKMFVDGTWTMFVQYLSLCHLWKGRNSWFSVKLRTWRRDVQNCKWITSAHSLQLLLSTCMFHEFLNLMTALEKRMVFSERQCINSKLTAKKKKTCWCANKSTYPQWLR